MKPTEQAAVNRFHFFHHFTKWQIVGEGTTRAHIHPNTGELLPEPVIVGKHYIQQRYCVDCGVNQFRKAKIR